MTTAFSVKHSATALASRRSAEKYSATGFGNCNVMVTSEPSALPCLRRAPISGAPDTPFRSGLLSVARTHLTVGYLPMSKQEYTPESAAIGVEQAISSFGGRWKLVILFHLFGGNMLRFSDLERAIPAVSQKMLIQQLRQMESDGIVRRIVHHQVPPKVEYGLTDWGQALCPALDALLRWAAARDEMAEVADASKG